MESRRILAVTGVVLIAWALRVVALDTLPPGIDRDAATNGVYALYILREGIRPLFYRIGAPEPLIIYAQALSVALFGVSVFALRIVTAVVGTLTIPALYLLARAFKFDGRVALLAAFGLAISIEHTHLSRLGLRAIFIPLVEMLALYFFWRVWQCGCARDAIIAGAILGIGYYTYLSAIFLPILLGALLAHQFVFDRARFVARGRAVVGLFATALGVAAPLLVFELVYPHAAFFRASQVTLFQHPAYAQVGWLGVLALKLLGQAKMFGIEWQGQYNPLSQPLLDPIWFAGFLIGVVICLRRARRIEYAWSLITIVVMLIPDLMGGNEVYPQELRVIGAIPPAFFIGAVGWVAAWDWSRRWQPHLANLLAVGLVLGSGVNTFDAYFNRWGKRDDPNFNLGEVAEGKWIARADAPVLVPLNEYARQPVRYLIGARAPQIRAFDAAVPLPASAWVVLPLDHARPRFEGRAYAHDPAMYVWVGDDAVRLLPPLQNDALEKLPNASAQEIRNAFGETVARAFWVDTSRLEFAPVAASTRAVPFAPNLALVDFALTPSRVLPGESLAVTLWWRTAQRLSDDAMIFVHLLDARGAVVTTADVIPALGAYPTFLWKPGELVPTHHRIRVPARAAPGKYSVEIGLYNPLDSNRFDVLDDAGKVADSRVLVGSIKVAPRDAIAYNPEHAQRANFDDRIALIGYDARPSDARAFALTLYWQGLATMEQDYTVFVHVLDAQDQIIAQADHQPQRGNYPTSIWDAGEVVRDEVALTLPKETPAGRYRVLIGWYDLGTGARVPTRDGVGNAIALDVALEVR